MSRAETIEMGYSPRQVKVSELSVKPWVQAHA